MARHDKKLERVKAKALEKAISDAGGPAELAKFISENYGSITIQAIIDWRYCPPLRARQVVEAVKAKGRKTTVRELCPDFAEVFEPRAA